MKRSYFLLPLRLTAACVLHRINASGHLLIFKGVLEKFENLLNEYFQSENPQTIGLPSVAYCAYELNLFASYCGDLIKKETEKTAQEFIQSKVIDVAKERLSDPGKSVSEIAHELGFKYPQHIFRLFKQRVRQSPNEYRMLRNPN